MDGLLCALCDLCVSSLVLAFRDDYFVLAVLFLHMDQHFLFRGGGYVLPDIVGVDGEFPVSPVHPDRQADGDGAAEIDDLVDGGPDAPTRVKDIVDQDDLLVGHVEGQIGGFGGLFGLVGPGIVAVEGDVQGPVGDVGALDGLDLHGEAFGQDFPPALDADKNQVLDAFIAFQYFMGDPGEGTVHVTGLHDDRFYPWRHKP